jgi:hypothetical protein
MKRFTPHRWWLLTVLTAVPALSLAAGVPHLFTSGTVVSSAEVNANFAQLADRLTALEATPASGTYVRWGRTTCSNDAQVVYDGYIAGKLNGQSGSGVGNLCLNRTPEWLSYEDVNQDGAILYGTKYQTAGYGAGLGAISNYSAPCAVCEVPRRAQLMIPGSASCPSGWTPEYNGYLMSAHYTQQASDWLCVDAASEPLALPDAFDGHLLYPTEVDCGVIPCAPDGYVQDRELACVVCTK